MIFAPIGGLDGDLEHLARDQFAHLGDQSFAALVGEVAVDDDGERVDGFAGDEDVELDHGRFPSSRRGGSRARRSRGRRISGGRRSRGRFRSAAARSAA